MRQLLRAVTLGTLLATCAPVRPPSSRVRTPPPLSASASLPAPEPKENIQTAAPIAEPPWEDSFKAIDELVRLSIDQTKMPGCVVLVGRRDEILMHRAYGAKAVLPERIAMTPDTVFDLASLTKAIATTSSMMVLVDRGKVDLDAPAAKYVPELKRLPAFTVRQLLLHTSGLPAATPMSDWTTDRAYVVKRISEITFKRQPGEQFVYSDVGFVVLEEIVRRVSGTELPDFAKREVFEPLGMTETTFRPEGVLRTRAAPTELRDGAYMQGDVHDPRAWALGGVAGHAGLFSTALDLSKFARAMLAKGKPFASDKTFDAFLKRHDTPKGGRALGWDVDSTFATHRSALYSPKAFGHGGYTGTAMWIDPENDLYVVFLSNRVHPDGKGAVNPTVGEIGTNAMRATNVETGIDVLRAESFERLRGARVALVTNDRARARDGTSTIDALRAATDVKLAALFAPEHGVGADKEGAIADGSRNGVPVYGLYGERFEPTSAMLDGIDTIVFDLQDAGARFYTYASTMKRAMKVAADRGLRFVVLDRPNPIDGIDVEGPMLAAPAGGSGSAAFVNHHALPVRHGMTMGELAKLFAADDGIDVKLEVVRMKNWKRADYFDRTRLAWTPPSPNLRTVDEAVLYPAVALFEASNVSVGRGTDMPFEVIGAPWIDGEALARKLSGTVPGLSFEATTFTPRSAVHANKACKGIRIQVTDRRAFLPVRSGVAIALALYELHPSQWEVDKMDRLLQKKEAVEAIKAGKPLSAIEATWTADLEAFRAKRERFLLYR